MEELEPRLLLSADLVPFVDLPFLRTPFQSPSDIPQVQLFDASGESLEGNGQFPPDQAARALSSFNNTDRDADVDVASALAPAPYGPSEQAEEPDTAENPPDGDDSQRHELVFVDPNTPDYQKLVKDLSTDRRDGARIEVVMLAPDRHGIEQITDELAGHRDLDAVHVVSHGADGRLVLGAGELGTDDLETHGAAIRSWGHAMADGADLLLYGCDLAGGSGGRALIDALAGLTNVDVAASTDATGHASQGGDWDLEYSVGETETSVVFSSEVRNDWQGTLATEMMLSTSGDVVSGGQPGTDTWESGDALRVGDPNFSLGAGTTNGTVSVAFDMENFAAGANATALHYVSSDIQVGTSGFQLKAGDLLLAAGSSTTLSSTSSSSGAFTNNLTVANTDVFVFRPDTPGDYSAGTFAMLLESPMGGADIRGVSLIEQDTLVGDATVQAGDFFLLTGSPNQKDVILYETADVGAGTTSGTGWLFIKGNEVSITDLMGVELVEQSGTVGGMALDAGTLLLSTLNPDAVGDNSLPVEPQDVFALNVTSTTYVSGSSAATASMVFDGGGLAFDTTAEALDGVTFVPAASSNTAPVLNPAAPTLTTITEDDLANSGDSVSSILGASASDADGDPVGMAITGISSGNGTWEYSLDGGATWTAVGAVAESNALLLQGTDWVRFVPDGQNADSASITYRAWDQSGGNTAGTRVDTTNNGGFTPFSTATDTASITVTAVNDAPVLDNSGAMVLTDVNEDDTNPPGDTVDSIILSAGGDRITDVDSGAVEGIAVIDVDDTNGIWQYSTDGGGSWNAFGAVSDTSAVLLDTAVLVRFVPNANYNGPAGNLAFRAWDQTDGNPSGTTGVDVSTNGGTTAYSAATETATLDVIAVNDAPVVTDATFTVDENAAVGTVVGVVGASDVEAQTFTKMYWIDEGTNKIQRANPDGSNVEDLVTSGLIDPVDLKIDVVAQKIYWVDRGTDKVQRADLDGSAVEDLVTGLGDPRGIAIDPVGGKVYWTDDLTDKIQRANLDGTGVEDLITVGTQGLRGITLDTAAGKMYWTDLENNKIQRANLDGSNVEDLVTGLGDPRGIALDVNAGKMYWADVIADKIQRANLDGSGMEDVVTGLADPIGITVDVVARKIYWTDFAADKIQRADLDGSNVEDLVTSGLDIPVGISLGDPLQTLSYAITGGNTGGAFGIDAATGRITVADSTALDFESNPSFNLTVEVTDSDGLSGTGTITVNLNDQNDAPTAADSTVTTDEDTTYVFSAADFNFSDADTGDSLQSVEIVSLPSAGSLELGGVAVTAGLTVSVADLNNGDLIFTPDPDANGTGYASFDFTVSDGTASSSPANTITVDVTAVNDAPVVATNAGLTLDEGSTATITDAELEVSDVDNGPAEIVYRLSDVPANGVLQLSGVTLSATDAFTQDDIDSGRLAYMHDGSETTTDGFVFDVSDGTNTVTGSVFSISVTAINDAPVLDNSGAMTLTDVNEDDINPAGDTVADIIASAGGDRITDADSGAVEGIAVIGVDNTNGIWQYDTGFGWTDFGPVSDTSAVLLDAAASVRFVPDADYNGSAGNLTFRAWDQTDGNASGATAVDVSTNGATTAFSTATETATLDVTAVNDAPTAADNTVTTSEDTAYTFAAGDFGFSDVDAGDALQSVTIETLPTAGTLELSGVAVTAGQTIAVADITGGNLTFTPDPDANGAGYASFDFTVSDGTASSSPPNTLTVDVTAVNDAPVNSVPGPQSTDAGTTLIFSAAGGNAISVSDVDVGVSPVEVTLTATDGTLTLATTAGLTFSVGTGTDDLTMTFTGAVADVNAALDGLTFDPVLGFNGVTSLSITTDDQGQTGTGGAQSDTDTISINVDPVAPTAADDPGGFSTVVQSFDPLSYWRLGESSGTAAGDAGSTGNDGTYNGATLGEPGALAGDPDTGVRFDGASYAEIPHSKDYLLDNGTVQLWFNVDSITGLDQALFSKDHTGLGTGGHLTMWVTDTGTVRARLQNAVSDSHFVESASAVTAGQWHHAAFTFGSDGMALYVDGQLAATNAYTGGTGVTSGGVGNFEPIALGAGTTDSTAGSVGPLDDFFTGAIDEVAVFGGQLSASEISRLFTVGTRDYVVAEDNTLSVDAANGVLVNDLDPQDDPLSAVLVSGPASAASFTLNTDGSFSYAPSADFNGTDSFTYRADDGNGNLSNEATATIVVTAVNDPPANTVPAAQTTDEDTRLVFSTSNGNALSVSDLDAGGGELQVTLSVTEGTLTLAGTAGITFTGGANGTSSMSFTGTVDDINAALDGLAYDPTPNFSGGVSLSIATDDQGNVGAGGPLNDTDSVAITVNSVNDPPVITSNATPDVPENTTTVITVTSTDVDGGTPAYSITGGVDAPQFSIDGATGELRFDTAPNFEAPADADADNVYQVQITVDDGNGGTDVQDLSVTVTPVNEAPVLDQNEGLTLSEGDSEVVADSALHATDEDNTPDQIAFQVTSEPSYGRLELTTAPGTAITSFTQQDIDNNRVVYVHDDSNTTADSFTFTFDDGASGPQGPATFSITVIPVDDDAPVLAVNTGSTTSGGTADTITSTELRYDDEQLPANVTYTVTGGLADGHLELASAPGVAITSFSQADIDAGEVVYVRDDPDSTSDGFDFSVDDSQGNVLTGQTFAVTVSSPSDDSSDDTGIGPLVIPDSGTTDDSTSEVSEPEPSSTADGDGDGADGGAGTDADGSSDTQASTQPSSGGGLPPAAGDPGAAGSGGPTPTAVSEPTLEGRDGDGTGSGNRTYQRAAARVLAAHGALPSGLDVPAFRAATTAGRELASLTEQETFKESLDRVREEVRRTARVETTVVGSTVAVTTGLSVGYVLWLVRGGLLFASLLSSMPAWRVIDPLPVLARYRGSSEGDGDDESLDSLVSRPTHSAPPPPEESLEDGGGPEGEMPGSGRVAPDVA